MPLTYEQLAPALYRTAFAIHGKLPWFEPHELVNACWVMGNIQKLETVKFATKRARYDMFDYIRRETGSRNRQLATRKADALRNKGSNEHVLQNKDRPCIAIASLNMNLSWNEGAEGDVLLLEETISDTRERGSERIDTKDLFEKLCKGLNRRDALLLKLFFIEKMVMKEISTAIGTSESRISQMLSNLLPRIKIILENLGYENRVQQKPEPDRAEYKRLWRQEKLNRKRQALAV